MPVKRRIVKRPRRKTSSGRRLQSLRGSATDDYSPSFISSYSSPSSYGSSKINRIFIKPSIKKRRNVKQKLANSMAQKTFNNRVEMSDNITNAPTFKVGPVKALSFDEKVDRHANPPLTIKRQYAWSAECDSGRKGWFQIPINKLTTAGITYGDLFDDALTQAQRLTTESNTADPTLTFNQTTGQKAYIKYQSNKLRMINSATNTLEGKVTLYRYKKDADALFTNVNVPVTPINLMMLGSTQNLNNYAVGQENTYNTTGIGSGWKFDSSTAGVDYDANYDMPGSSVNTGGATAQTDPALQVFSPHVKELTGYFLSKVDSFKFSLKPGQQINHYTIFNNLPNIVRMSQEYNYLSGITYYLVIEFQAGIVGDSLTNNSISTGGGQLSCIFEEKRILGLRGRADGSRVYMPTPPLVGIAKSNQVTINSDTGVQDVGLEDDA